jgi:hypothetical protein
VREWCGAGFGVDCEATIRALGTVAGCNVDCGATIRALGTVSG